MIKDVHRSRSKVINKSFNFINIVIRNVELTLILSVYHWLQVNYGRHYINKHKLSPLVK